MRIILLAVLIGLIPAGIAQYKGKSFGVWWFYGAALFIIALPHALLMSADKAEVERRELSDGSIKKCPFCAEFVKVEAIKCKHCQSELPHSESSDLASNDHANDASSSPEEALLAATEKYGITYDGKEYYLFGEYRYTSLKSAIDYAELQRKRAKA